VRLLLRVFYALLYHPFAWTYDWVAALVSCGKWQTWVRATLPYLHGPVVLELGYGPGHLQKLLSNEGIFAFGIDASWEMSRLAQRNLLRERYPVRLINGYAQSMPFPDCIFEQVVATFPTHYIIETDTLSEIWRVLKPDGNLVILAGGLPVGKKACQRLSAWLFRASGQAPEINESSLLKPFLNAGFETKCVTNVTADSKLLFILAHKLL
jgi:ubiquinone/menaquinone biosynthesis C-methylase UbiE